MVDIGFSRELLVWAICSFIWYQFIAHIGISLGLHRYFAHRQFHIPVFFEYLILFLATLAGARSPIGWIAAHRMHHAYSDTKQDPHSPKYKGFWNIFFSRWSIKQIPSRFSKDLYSRSSLKYFHRNWKKVWFFTAAVSLVFGCKFFMTFVFIPAILAYVSFGLINSVCHIGADVKNVPLLNILTAGEGYHLEHHRNGKEWRFHKYDTTGVLIQWLIHLRLVK